MASRRSAWEAVRERSSTLVRNLERLAGEVEQLAAKGGDPLRGAEIVQGELDRWERAVADLGGRGRRVLEALRKTRDSAAETFEQRIARELRDKGHEVHGETALLIVNGLVHLEMDIPRATIRITRGEPDPRPRDAAAHCGRPAAAQLCPESVRRELPGIPARAVPG
jgi:hypothetical protein